MWLNVRDYGAKGDGVTDDSQAFQHAAGDSTRNRSEGIFLPVGVYLVVSPWFLPTGVPVIGDGCVGSNKGDGSWIELATPDGDPSALINYTGAYQYRGSGGLLRDLSISRVQGRSGGTAIRMTAAAADKRVAWPTIDRVKVYSGTDAGHFDNGLVVDGSAVQLPGGAGVRDLTINNLSVQGCKVAVDLKYAVNGLFIGGEYDPGGTQWVPSFKIGRGCQQLRFIGISLYGQMYLENCDRIKVVGCGLSAVPIVGSGVTNLEMVASAT